MPGVRIVVSGTHASGKSTLISDFASAHPEYAILGDPFDGLLDEFEDAGPASFAAQLRVSASRLRHASEARLIAERGPLDFVAYLLAWSELGRGGIGSEAVASAARIAADAMETVDLLILLPAAGIRVPEDEDPELRAAMQDQLFELCDDSELVGAARVVELAGDPVTRLKRLEELVAG